MGVIPLAVPALFGVNLLAFGWGMSRFFSRSADRSTRTHMVGSLGVLCTLIDLRAIAGEDTDQWRSIAASLLYLLALLLFAGAVRACRHHRPTAIFDRDLPRILISDGPYRYMRHPFYVAYALFWVAGWVATGAPTALLAACVMVGVYAIAARAEERKFAASPLAGQYRAYARRIRLTGRWCR